MKKTILLPALFFVPMMLLAGGCYNNQPAYQPTPTSPSSSSQPSQNSTQPTQNQVQPGGNQTNAVAVTIQNFAFSPANITIKKGETVTWTNQDSAPHQIASDSNAFQGPAISKGQTYSFTFNDTGTFPYHCAIHPMMKGTVVVQ